jgi:hypothetical protein
MADALRLNSSDENPALIGTAKLLSYRRGRGHHACRPRSGAATLAPPPRFQAGPEHHRLPPRSTKLDDKLKVLPPAQSQSRGHPGDAVAH